RRLLLFGTDSLAIGIEHQSGGKGSDDVGQADRLGDKGQCKAKRQPKDKYNAVFSRPSRQSDDGSSKEMAGKNSDSEKQHSFPMIAAISRIESPVPSPPAAVTIPVTTANTIKPKISSKIAAPRMI